MRVATACRWLAIALAAAAIVDPQIPLPRAARPFVRVLASGDRTADAALRAQLTSHGFSGSGDREVAAVARRDAAIAALPGSPLYVVNPPIPEVSIERAAAGGVRVPGQSVAVAVRVHGQRVTGRTTTLRLEDGGLTVATATHRWTTDDERWETSMMYLPAEPAARRLRIRADATAGESDLADNAADVLAPPQRSPIRTLVFAPAVTWPAVFVRRTLEADPAFDVASLQRATKNAVTRGGAPPATLTRGDLEPYEVLVSASMDFDPAGREAVRWFVEERGGVAVFVPDRVPEHADRLVPGLTFESRVVETPVGLRAERGALAASELAVPRNLPPFAAALAADASGVPVVFSARRGAGALIVSGALDAWRYRDSRGFDEFWRTMVLADAVTVPPRLGVTVAPSVVRPGDRVRITARLRRTELPPGGMEVALPPASAQAVAPRAHEDQPIRLWPATEPGVYEGEWTAAAPGEYAIDVTIGPFNGAAVMIVDSTAASLPGLASRAATAARASGGEVVEDEGAAVRVLAARFPASTALVPGHPARTVWWVVAFTVLLCAEWAMRRRQGLP